VRFLGVHPGPLMYTKVFLRLEPLGLELVAQSARRAGHEVRLIDLQVEDHRAYFRLLRNWRCVFLQLFGERPRNHRSREGD
jgi:magnesium-protoporphyrin IX monomethyl ester (oxidative) cyclase